MFNKMLDDVWLDEMDPMLRRLTYEHWVRDEEQQYEMLKSQAILIGSFANPDAAKAMIKSDSPDFESSEKDYEQSLKMVEEDRKKAAGSKRKRQRRVKKENS
ncbi:MAG TPA: hypothetical protein VI423_03805 [Paenisporosarcina sp.]|nr:hypothetical protein [Paenisporosarcina sp.]